MTLSNSIVSRVFFIHFTFVHIFDYFGCTYIQVYISQGTEIYVKQVFEYMYRANAGVTMWWHVESQSQAFISTFKG